MANNLVIVESPAKAKTIKKYLGNSFSVVASMGHIIDLPKSKLGVDVDNNFEPYYITIRGKAKLLKELKQKAKDAKKVYLATDPDREGEAISWHLANALNLEGKDVYRVAFNEITKGAVKAAVDNPRDINTNLVNAQQARRVLDRIVGYKISPLLWKKVKKGLSAGRVQSVTTRLVCDREEEIEKFVPEEYWLITAFLNDPKSKKDFTASFYGKGSKRLKLESAQQVNEILAVIEKGEYIVANVKIGEKKQNPSPPFITSTLQQEAARKLGFTAVKTMSTAQQLYEGIEIAGHGAIGLITYMRTDSLRVSNDAITEARGYIASMYGEQYLPKSQRVYKSRRNSQDAHEAIRPTTMDLMPDSIKGSLGADQYKLYKIIWNRFIASQMESAIFDSVSADIDVSEFRFRASGSKLKFDGFTKVYTESKDNEEDEDGKMIPLLTVGQTVIKNKLEKKQQFTQPPARYTEASLIKELEELGIGRPSTYAPTITTIMSRGYVAREKKNLYPTELGKITTQIMKNYFANIVDVAFTANMETDLDDIEEGNKKWVSVISDFYAPFEETMKAAEEGLEKITIKDEESDVVCDKCGRMLVYKVGKFGKFLACPGFPECRNTKAITEEAGADCPKCGKKVLIRKSKKGKKYYGCEDNPTCEFMTWDDPVRDEKCPKCGKSLFKNTDWKTRTTKFHCLDDQCGYSEIKESKKDKESKGNKESKKGKGNKE